MTLHQFLLALRGRIGTFVALLAATVLAAIAVTLVMPRTYEATVSVLVDVKDEQSFSQPAGSARNVIGYMQTQIDIIQSKRVARQVVEDLRLAENPSTQAAFAAKGSQGSIEDWLADSLLYDLKVDSTQSSVIQVKYSASDPKSAAGIANAFANAYVGTSLKLRTEPTRAAANWFDEQLKGLRDQLEQAQLRLGEFQRKHGILVADERMDVETARLNELSQQALRAADESYAASARLGQARGKRSNEMSPDVIANPLITTLKAELLRAETRLSELATRLGPAHPQYQAVATEVKALRERMNAEMAKVIGGVESTTASHQARQAALQRDLAEQRRKVEALRDARHESVVLQRDVDTAQKAYEAALGRYLVNKVESGARQTNVTVLNPAAVPSMPAKPRVAVNIALGIFVGLLLGFAAVFFLELLDRRVRSTTDLEIGIEAPLLGTLQPWQPSRLLGAGENPRALPGPA